MSDSRPTRKKFGQIAGDIVRSQKDLQSAPPAHQTWQPRHGAATRYEPGTDFPLGENGLLAAGEPHVAGQREFRFRHQSRALRSREAIDTTGAAKIRTSMSGSCCSPWVREGGSVESSAFASKS